jgi:hypothetical protein
MGVRGHVVVNGGGGRGVRGSVLWLFPVEDSRIHGVIDSRRVLIPFGIALVSALS